MTAPADVVRPPNCDNTSVGVLITDGVGRYLMFDRATPPPGTAPAAGHVDQHGSWLDAAREEVAEELGLEVVRLDLVAGGWRANRCRRRPGPRGVGHDWRVYAATTAGELAPSTWETRNCRWLSPEQIAWASARTVAYANGRITDADFAARPGIEPVWLDWLVRAGAVQVDPAALTAVDRLAAAGSLLGPNSPEDV